MQPAADVDELQSPDLVIPWPIVGAVVCIALASVIAWVFGGIELVSPDRNLHMPIFKVISAGDYLLDVSHARIVGFGGMLTAAAIVLALSFRANGFFSRLRKIFIGALPGIDLEFDKRQLVQAEILTGSVAVIYLVGRLAHVPDAHGFPSRTNVFTSTTIAILGFWALLAEIAWINGWNAFARWLVTVLFVLCFAIDTMWCLQWGVTVSGLLASYLLGAAILLIAKWLSERYA